MHKCSVCKLVLKHFSQQISEHDCKKIALVVFIVFVCESEQRWQGFFCISVLFQLTTGSSNERRIDMGAIISQIINTASMRSN
jgi:hypothetical protein